MPPGLLRQPIPLLNKLRIRPPAIKWPALRFPFFKTAQKRQAARFLGFDVGSYSVKWVEIECAQETRLVSCHITPVPPNTSHENRVAILKEAARSFKREALSIRTAIPGQSVIVRYLHFPKMSREELRSHVAFEADKYIPFNIKDVVLDCHILSEAKEESKILALIVAAKKEIVEQHLAMLEEAGLEAEVLDVDTFAVINAFEHAMGNALTGCHCLMDIGAKATNVSVLQGTSSFFSRSIPIGGTDFTQAISEKLDLEMVAAEVVKCRGEKKEEELLNLVASPLEHLMREVKASLDYFENQFDQRVERIYLSGGSSCLRGVGSVIQQNVGFEALSWNPLKGVVIPDELLPKTDKMKGSLAVAAGLALRNQE